MLRSRGGPQRQQMGQQLSPPQHLMEQRTGMIHQKKKTSLTLSTSGWLTMAAPAVGPNPGMMLTTPGGKPASLISWATYRPNKFKHEHWTAKAAVCTVPVTLSVSSSEPYTMPFPLYLPLPLHPTALSPTSTHTNPSVYAIPFPLQSALTSACKSGHRH